ncbi:histidinol-phosphate transaminase [Mumia sp. zg.B53]|uniref:histidinol-phosphate transaminase n=1 Tax=unclassified Mumia TaxID=2621872 RepID=UPI001C6E98BC|nr:MULTISPECIES: histidinol-phosphate transaminase [unclassified Mumia]MBW9204327.1 histidinol-phosphate transaminase [Mumia sp. zg.B17]MBW9209688.1 histidinol-phosphate transaminase [Mumia sp. zg.B21]MBW9214292.1 histidinol-phosphate transaminase [Mumia sp. zg.B53]MDD9348011.1 histidinol-phosphate transaminase [Mumia sp.]
MGEPRIRQALDGVPDYRPGRPPTTTDDRVPYKLSSNENPYPPLPSVLDAIDDAARRVNRYPDMGAVGLYAALAQHHAVPTTDLAAATGSVAVLYHLLQATCEAGDEVVYAWRSFEAYPIAVRLVGATPVEVPLTAAAEHDLEAMLAAITPRTRVVIVCTPNNPTGPAVEPDALAAFVDAVPDNVLVVVDEAYAEFVRRAGDSSGPEALEHYRARDNVVVLRTFSKAYGLAGLRVGYAVAPARIASAVRKVALPFGVSDVAQAAAVASLAAEKELFERVDAIVAERDRTVDAARAAGWPVPDTQANFFWLPTGARTLEVAEAFGRDGLAVRPFAGDGMRITIGEPGANDRVLDVLRRQSAGS